MNKNFTALAFGFFISAFLAPGLAAQEQKKDPPVVATDTTGHQLLYHRRESTLTAESVSEIHTSDLQKTFSTNFGGMITGRITGLYGAQLSGKPGSDDVSLYVRGRVPMIVLNGIPQSFSSIDPEQIESVTVLKDALSTAMYGMRGANGVILITTKKVNSSKINVSFTAQSGIQQPLGLPHFLSAYDYATLYNEARVNDGNTAAYSQADLDAYKNGTRPFDHPDVNWQDQVLKKQSAIGRYNMAISGSGAGFRYFINAGYLAQEGIFKSDKDRVYDSNVDFKRYNLQSAVDLDITKALTASVNLYGRILNYNQPGATAESILSGIQSTPNSAYPVFNVDGSLAGNLNFQNNIYGQVFQSGYRPSNGRDFKVDGNLKLKLDDLVKGLWVKTGVAVRAYNLEDINRSRTFAVFQDMSAGAGTSYKQFNTIGDQSNTSAINTQFKETYAEFSLGYNKQSGRSNWDALVISNSDSRVNNSDLAISYATLAGNLAYTYDARYIVQVAGSYSGSNHYPSGNRYGFFPSAGVAWVVSNESFLKSSTWLKQLKLRASYGISGYDAAGYFDYMQYYIASAGYNFGNAASAVTGLTQDGLASYGETWEKAKKLNIGIDASFFNDHFNLTADYYNNDHYDLLQQPGTATSLLGVAYPNENIGRNRYSGIELQLTYQNARGAFSYFLSPNVSLLKTKVLFQDEAPTAYSYMQRTGQPVGQLFGYVADGLFRSQAEADASPKPFPGVKAGDIKYKDLNSDGLINGLDQTAIGNTKPQIYYGLNLGIKWRGLDLSALIQGVTNRNLLVMGGNFVEFQNGGLGQAYDNNLNRWTPATAATATYPRVSVGTNLNNSQVSSFWVQSGSYLRLKSVDVGYTLPSEFIRHLKVSKIRFYVNGTNLLTASPYKLSDPEAFNAVYPLQKMLIAGLNVNF